MIHNKIIKNKGQVWIETVLYTLIGLALMGTVLAFVMPKLSAGKDKIAIEQTIKALNEFDDRVNSLLQSPGNARNIYINMQRGTFTINSTSDEVSFFFNDLSEPYSQPGAVIKQGRVEIVSQKTTKGATVSLKIKYNNNITYNLEDKDKIFNAVSVPYSFSIENMGILDKNLGKEVVDIQLLSN